MSVPPLPPEDELKMIQNSIQFLHALSTSKELDVPILKSSFSIKRRLMELRRNTFLPNNVTQPNQKCPRCLLNWSEGPATYRIKSRPKQHKFAKKIISKLKHGLALTEYQQKYHKKMDKFDGNYLIVTCKFCQKETEMKLEKPAKIEKPKPFTTTKQKKKKKRDKFCGLNQDVVLSLTPHNPRNLENKGTVSLDSDIPQTPKFKLSKRDTFQKVVSIHKNITESLKKKKKKNKNLNKLSEVLKSASKTSSSSTSLKHFLKGL